MAIQQVQRLGSIWKNEDLSVGQRILQTVTNLAMSLPMLVNGYLKLNQALKLVIPLRLREAAAAAAAARRAGDTEKESKAIDLYAAETEKATGKVKMFNGALAVDPTALWIAGISAAITILGIWINSL